MGQSHRPGRRVGRWAAWLVVTLLTGTWASALAQTPEAPPAPVEPPPEAPQPSVPAPPLVPQTLEAHEAEIDRILVLCRSHEIDPRRFCLDQLVRLTDPSRRARQRLLEMASGDPELHDRAAALIAYLYREPPPPYRAAPEVGWPRDPGRTRTVFFPTAYTTPQGHFSMDIIDIGYWDLNYGVNDNVEIGLRTMPPITVVGFFPQVKLSLPFEGGAFSVHVMGGAFLPYIDSINSKYVVYLVGGGPALTLGSSNLTFTLGFEAYGIYVDHDKGGVILPYAGASLRLSRRVSLGVEALVPGIWAANKTYIGDVGIVLYGLRISGHDVWGDIAFAAPICNGCGQIYKDLPLGIPMLGFGFQI